MNYQEPYNINNIDLDKIVYPNSRSTQNKKIILIKYNENNKLRNFVFQTPTLLNLYKANELNNYSEIEVSLSGKEKLKTQKFINFLSNLEDKIKNDAIENYSSWFDININIDNINFQKTIRESDDYEDGTIKIKILNNNDFKTNLQFNNNSNNIKINQIPENSWCKMILECYAVWINGNNDFGLFIRPILISFVPKEVYKYKFIEDSDEEQVIIPETEVNDNIFMNINKIKNNMYNNSTTQLEVNELVNNLDSKNNIETSDFIGINNLNTNNNLFTNESNSSSINGINETLLNAETSE